MLENDCHFEYIEEIVFLQFALSLGMSFESNLHLIESTKYNLKKLGVIEVIANITLEFDKLTVPVHINHILQATILSWLSDENYSKFIHDVGYTYGKRRYKLFSFSSLYGPNTFDKKTKKVTFYDKAKFFLSAVDEAFFEYVLNTIIHNSYVRVSNQEAFVSKISFIPPVTTSKVVVKTMSPIVVYATDDSDKVHFFSPHEPEFEEYIVSNAKRKIVSYFGKDDSNFTIKHIGSNPKKAVVQYKKGFFVGWKTMFEIEGDPEIINFLIGSGLGSKNSAGFGCVVPVEHVQDV